MHNRKAVTVALGVVLTFVFTAISVQADAIHSDKFVNLNGIENHRLDLPEVSQAEQHAYVFTGVHSNNGKHLGFSIAAVHRGPRLGIVKPSGPTVTQNPEPASMILLGTGLAAVGAAIRRRRKV